MPIPPDYQGREQTYLKHEVLRQYLQSWGQKLASIGRKRSVRLWFVDCFAGPWRAEDQSLDDTSAAIGIDALKEAVRGWREKGASVQASAIFIERDARSFRRLAAMLGERTEGIVDVHPMQGRFGDKVEDVDRLVGDDPAFLFVDPTGWKDIGMHHVARLAQPRWRDVLINVMYDHLNRFKDDNRAFLRAQMRDLFGLGDQDLPPGLAEEALMDFYRQRLAATAKLTHVADLAIPHPSKARTYFRLVVGGHVPAALELFRDVEDKVIGRVASDVRESVRRHQDERRLGQLSLDVSPPDVSREYRVMKERDRQRATIRLRQLVGDSGDGVRFDVLWPTLLSEFHLRKTEVKELVRQRVRSGSLAIKGRQGTVGLKESDVLVPGVPRLFE